MEENIGVHSFTKLTSLNICKTYCIYHWLLKANLQAYRIPFSEDRIISNGRMNFTCFSKELWGAPLRSLKKTELDTTDNEKIYLKKTEKVWDRNEKIAIKNFFITVQGTC